MLMVIDIGNSNIVIGVYKDENICFFNRIATEKQIEPPQYAIIISELLKLNRIDKSLIKKVIVSSVVPRLNGIISEAVKMLCDADTIQFGAHCCPDLSIDIDNPKELGCDLVASAYYVRNKLPLPAIIIDAGTATKISAIDKDGVFKGVAIAPGMFISLDALVRRTSLLMDIPVSPPPAAIGTNTQNSIKSGILFGTAAMLDGMVDRFLQELGDAKTIIATGGAAPIVVPLMRHNVIMSKTLILDGLALSAGRSE